MKFAKVKFGKRLKKALEDRGMKGVELANLIGVEPPSVSRWINGKAAPDEANFAKILSALKLNESYFFETEPEQSDLEKRIAELERRYNTMDELKGMSDIIEALKKADETKIRAIRVLLGLHSVRDVAKKDDKSDAS